MKILSLSLDNSVLNKTSALAERVIKYGDSVDKYTVIVPGRKNEKVSLSEKTIAYGFGGNNKLRQFIKIYSAAKKLLRVEKYDVITVQDQYYLALIGVWLAKKFRVGLEIQVHGFEKFFGWRRMIARYVLPGANAVRCVSQRLKKELINKFGVAEKKITVVPIYSKLPNIDRQLPAKENKNKFIFLTVSRLVPVKNIGLQIEAMSEIVKKYPETELWIIGDGPEKEKLRLEIGNWKLENNAKLFGWRNDLEKFYNQADAFILTSNAEGWGLAVIEAASFGLPIIMAEVGCAGEVIRDRESGLIIPVGDKRKLIEAMLEVIKDENLRKKLGIGARLAAKNLPGEEQTLDLYKISWQKAALK